MVLFLYNPMQKIKEQARNEMTRINGCFNSCLQSNRNALGLWLRGSLHMGGCELLTISLLGSWACEVKGISGVSYMTPHDFISEELP